MRFSTLLPLLSTASAVYAGKVWDVQVGDSTGAQVFNPEAIAAQPGDQVVFHFQQKNHTATQSSFDNPCGKKDGGFDSGFMPVPANQTDNFPTYTITVNDTNPVWVYCKQAVNTAASHCGNGMVFAVNCGADGAPNSFTNFKQSAIAIGNKLKAEASAASSAAPDATAYTTAAYGTVTIPPAPTATVVTVTVTVEASTWTSTYSSYPGSPAATPASLEGNVHVVKVGNSNGTLRYDPQSIQAAPRDTVVFEFHQKNHTATLSSFDSPCIGQRNSDGSFVADSGFQSVDASAATFPTWNFTVQDTTPKWFYCRQKKPDGGSHCGDGMVFAINPVETSPRNFSAFQSLAMALNGTAAGTNSSSGGNSSTGGSSGGSGGSGDSNGNGAMGSLSMNLAVGLGSVLAVFATLL